jgi:hypothetical protein
MQIEGLLELVTSLFNDLPVMDVLNMVMGLLGPVIGDLFK